MVGIGLRVPANLLRQRPSDVLSPAALVRRAYRSFATAWQVKRDLALVHPVGA